jgi:pimeloyl-ACP methyl ester carboxylesterase
VPDLARVSPSAAGLSQAEEVMLTTADSERLIAWHVAPQSDRPVILYLQGIGGALRHRVHRFAQLLQHGFGVFAVSYRGFGGSTGSPSETGLLLDAEAAYAFCTDYYAAERIVVWGESLGTGVAVALASKHLVGRLILEAPFTSAADVARLSYRLIPVGLLMKDQFRSCAGRRDHGSNLGAAR